MDYQAVYDRLIERAHCRVREGYSERHHIIPRCLGGSNAKTNLVRLTAEEHFVAHQLLVKLHPGHLGLVSAVYAMINQGKIIRTPNNKIFGWIRRRMSQAMTGTKRPPEVGRKISQARMGMIFTEEHRANISRGRSGWQRPAEVSERIAAKLRGVKRNPAIGAKVSASKKGKPATVPPWNKGIVGAQPSTRKGKSGKPHTTDQKAKISAALLARRGLPKKKRASPSAEALLRRGAAIKAAHARRRAAQSDGKPTRAA